MSLADKSLKVIVELARIVVGATFAFSGFVKAADPLGFTYKIQDYLINLHLTALFPAALPLSVFMVVTEFVLGILLLLGVYRRCTTILVGLFMAFFTPLTLWIAIANPVADCGCFGDALIITNWQTFYKNIVLSVFALILIVCWRKITPLFSRKTPPFAALFVTLFGLLFAFYNIYDLPVLDFRPYKIGSNISEKMYVNSDEADVYENIFIYSKDGVEKEFTEENYPWNDSTWVFVDMKSSLIKEGKKSEIEDFSIHLVPIDSSDSLSADTDVTERILSNPDFTFLMPAYSLEDMHIKHLNRFKEIAAYAQSKNIPFYCLTSSSADAINKWEKEHETNFIFGHADERVLKTMIRSNPGLILLHNGTVFNKWSNTHIPTPSEMESVIGGSSKPVSDAGKILFLLVIFIIPLIVLKVIDTKLSNKLETTL